MNAAMGDLFAWLVSQFFDCLCFLVTSWCVAVGNNRRFIVLNTGFPSCYCNTGNMPKASQANLMDFPGFGVTRVTVRGRPEVLFNASQMSEGVRISHEEHTAQQLYPVWWSYDRTALVRASVGSLRSEPVVL